MRNIFTDIEEFVADYERGSITIVDGYEFNQSKKLREVEFYSNSKFLNGNTDELKREKPFFNIVNANVDVAVVATDLDTKDIKISSKNREGDEKAFLLSREGQRWMRKVNYAKHLNKRGETRARYGGVLVKKTEDENDLTLDVVTWKNIVVNPTKIARGTKVERHWMSALDLSKKRDSWTATEGGIEDAIELAKKAKADGYQVEVWEVEGEFPKSYFTEKDSDENEYALLCFYILKKGKKEIVLYKELLEESRYKYLPWKERPGNPEGLGIGVVEEGTEAQVWTNDAMIAERNIMDLAGKVVLWTDDPKLEGKNVITDVNDGTTISLTQGKNLNLLNLTPASLPEFQNLVERWRKQFDRSAAITDALRGETPPSGQAYRTNVLVTQQSGSQFDYRREEAGIFEKEIWTDWIIPFLKKQLKKQHTLVAEFSKEELNQLDESYVNFLVDQEFQRIKKENPNALVDPMQVQSEMDGMMQKLSVTKARRYLDVPKGYYDDVEEDVDVETTGEAKNKTATLESLASIFTQIQSTYNPQTGKFMALEDPVLSEIFYQIVEGSGAISPITLEAKARQQQPVAMPMQTPNQMVTKPSSLPNPQGVGPEAMNG